jgi:mRNA interferase HigB
MKVHLIKRETIEEYAIDQARSRPSFEEWLEKVKRADWQAHMRNTLLYAKKSNNIW